MWGKEGPDGDSTAADYEKLIPSLLGSAKAGKVSSTQASSEKEDLRVE